MNLIKKLDEELSQKNLNDFEKARYIYLRCCELFSFDARWFFTDVYNDIELHDKLRYKKFDIENIDDDLVICHSFSEYILKPLIDELTTLDCRLHKDENHSCVFIKRNGTDWKLDATLGDLARVKLDIPTTGFASGYISDDLVLDDIDLELGYCLKNIEEYERMANGNSFTDCIENIGYILRDSKAKYHYSDVLGLYDMLAAPYSIDNHTYLEDNYKFHRLIELFDEYSFFDLSKEDGEYRIKRIRPDEYKHLVKTLKCK